MTEEKKNINPQLFIVCPIHGCMMRDVTENIPKLLRKSQKYYTCALCHGIFSVPEKSLEGLNQ